MFSHSVIHFRAGNCTFHGFFFLPILRDSLPCLIHLGEVAAAYSVCNRVFNNKTTKAGVLEEMAALQSRSWQMLVWSHHINHPLQAGKQCGHNGYYFTNDAPSSEMGTLCTCLLPPQTKPFENYPPPED